MVAVPTAEGRSATDYSGGIYGLTFRSTAGIASFLGVQVDGVTLDPSRYIAEGDDIEIYLKAVYLQTLQAGTHTITILSSEGNASHGIHHRRYQLLTQDLRRRCAGLRRHGSAWA